MGFLEDLTKKASGIVSQGKSILRNQLGSETVYQRDVGIVSSTGNKPKIATTAKDFFLPGRGFTDEQIKAAKPTTKETVTGVAKAAGEIVQGGLTLTHMLGNKVADTVLPGYDAQAAADYRNRLNEKVTAKLTPKTAGEAKVMRGADIAGFLPVGSISKGGKLSKIEDVVNSRTTGMVVDTGKQVDGEKVLQVTVDDLLGQDTAGYGDLDPERVQYYVDKYSKGGAVDPLRVQAIEGNLFVEDGKHRLAALRELGADFAEVVDATPAPKSNLSTKPTGKAPVVPKQFDVPRTSTGEVDGLAYIQQMTKAREAARGGKTVSSKVSDFFKNIEDKLIDFTSPIQRRYTQAMKSDPLFAASQKHKTRIQDNIDRVFNAPAITSAFVKDKGFSKVIQSVGVKNLDAFDQYLTAKHALDLSGKGIKTGRSAEADAALIRQLGPKFEKAAKEVQKYNNERLQYMVDSGLISRELKDELLTKHPNYVPFQRVFSEEELANAGNFNSPGVASLSKQTVVQKIVGSNREIESPLESLLELTSKAIVQGEKNKAALTLTSYADIKGNPFGLRKISKTTDAAPGKDTISVLRNGKKEIWEVDAEIAKAAKALDVERMNILGKILAAPLRLARLGITGVNVPFVAANVVRDQIGAFIMSDKGLRSSVANPRIWLAGLGEAIKHDVLYNEMLSEGALMTSFDVVRDSVKPTLKGIAADKSRLSKAKYIASNPSQWFRAVEDAIGRSEEVTRMQQYLGNKQAALAEGATEAEARVIAARAARENSTNFARRGEWGTVMNNTILYLNAGIQGSRLLVRNLKNKPAKTATKIATTLMFPAATIAYWNLSDPKRKEAYEDIQEYEKENNFIIVPPNPVKDDDGRWNVIKVPLPPGVGQFTNFIRRPLEASYDMDPVKFTEAAGNLLRVVSPTDLSNPMSSLTPQIIKPSLQAGTNQNFFTGYDIVPKSMQDLPVEQQVKETTSGTAIDVANTLGTSPIKTEQFINDTLGGVGPQILNAADRLTNQEQVGGRSILESVSRRFSSAAGNRTQADQLDEIYSLKTEARGGSAALKVEAESTLAELRAMPKDEANVQLKQIFDQNRPLYDAITKARKQEDRGLSKVEAAIEDLPVKDGTRATYIYNQYLDIKAASPEDAKAYLVDLRKKKVISDEVLEQIKALNAAEGQ